MKRRKPSQLDIMDIVIILAGAAAIVGIVLVATFS